MLKPFIFGLGLISTLSAIPPVDTPSQNVLFETFSGAALSPDSLENYEGKIIIITYYTPWCPTCASVARQVGRDVSKYFVDNGGASSNGIEVVSLLLSTEVGGGSNDSTTMSIANLNHYHKGGLDSTNTRMDPREGFEFFRGQAITSWPVGDRRRVVIINGSQNSASHEPWEILYNEQFPSSNTMIETVNSVTQAPPLATFEEWVGGYTFPLGLETPNADPDLDGATNIEEFFAGTNPIDGRSGPILRLVKTSSGVVFKFQTATDRVKIPFALQGGSLDNFITLDPDEDDISASAINEDLQEVSIKLPPTSGPFFRILLTHP